MSKRMISILIALTILLSSFVVPVGAAQTVNYTVYAFRGGYASTDTAQSTVLNTNSRLVFASMNTTVGGYSIAIPPNTQSGYFLVAGIFPIRAYTVSGTGWQTPSQYEFANPYYFISSQIGGAFTPPNSPEPFSGIVYIPAHTTTIYLNVYGYSTGQAYPWGAYRLSGSIMQFIPDVSGDSSGTDRVIQQLQQVNQSIQNVYNEIQSSPEDNQYAEELLEELKSIMDTIDELTQQIEENTNRPPPDDIVPSIPPVLLAPSDVPSQDGRTAITDILASSFLTNILIMVFSLAFLRYVLFGKSK